MSRLLSEDEAAEFRHILDGYRPNNDVLDLFKSSNFAIIAGPAGAGKDTLRNGLIQKYPDVYVPILSTTSRPPRINEKDGVDYHFREAKEIKKRLIDREFFQSALVHNQQVSCLDINEIKKLQSGQWGLSILIPITEQGLREIKPDIKTVFLIPPSVGILKDRIQSERMLDDAEVKRRLEAAIKEMQYAQTKEHYYCLVSDTVNHVVERSNNFIQNNQRNSDYDNEARQVINKIMLELQNE